jgi:hypothetical protein
MRAERFVRCQVRVEFLNRNKNGPARAATMPQRGRLILLHTFPLSMQLDWENWTAKDVIGEARTVSIVCRRIIAYRQIDDCVVGYLSLGLSVFI